MVSQFFWLQRQQVTLKTKKFRYAVFVITLKFPYHYIDNAYRKTPAGGNKMCLEWIALSSNRAGSVLFGLLRVDNHGGGQMY